VILVGLGGAAIHFLAKAEVVLPDTRAKRKMRHGALTAFEKAGGLDAYDFG
jgi:hypothetical protein